MKKYLDLEGLATLWEKCKSFIHDEVAAVTGTDNLIYKAESLSFDGTNYVEVDFSPFAEDAPNFQMTMNMRFDPSESEPEYATMFSVHTYTDPEDFDTHVGFTIRKQGTASDNIDICLNDVYKRIYLTTSDDEVRDSGLLIVWTKIGNLSYVIYSQGTTHGCITFSHTNNFDNKIVLGAATKPDDATVWRYAVGYVDYIKIVKL